MREMKLVRGEVTVTINVATLVDRYLDEEEIEEIIGELADNETCDMDIEIELFDETNLNLNERISKEYENNKICSNDWIDLLNKADKEDSEIVEVLPGQIGFEI